MELLSPELELPARLGPDLGPPLASGELATRPTWGNRERGRPGYALRGLSTVGALAVTALGVVPIVGATINSRADPIVYQAIDGPPTPIDVAVPNLVLRDQSGRIERLAALRGKVVVLAFLDPVASESSRALGRELAQADGLLAAELSRVEFVAIDTSRQHRSPAVLRAFDRAQGLAAAGNWLFLTGPVKRLAVIWKAGGVGACGVAAIGCCHQPHPLCGRYQGHSEIPTQRRAGAVERGDASVVHRRPRDNCPPPHGLTMRRRAVCRSKLRLSRPHCSAEPVTSAAG